MDIERYIEYGVENTAVGFSPPSQPVWLTAPLVRGGLWGRIISAPTKATSRTCRAVITRPLFVANFAALCYNNKKIKMGKREKVVNIVNKLDILNRDVFVDQLLRLVEIINSSKASTCFAINGPWGCGKSFVLDTFEEQLARIQSEETHTHKYFIVRYNSWKFDYYEEPLVAIVATMISVIEEKTKLFPDSQERREILGMLKAVGVSLGSLANSAIKEKIGVDIQAAYKTVCSGQKEGAAAYKEDHSYDVYFGFNKVLGELIELLQGLAKEYTVVIMVDELDRCLPEYAIKVLERLHHLTEDTSNIVTIIAIDKTQLMASINQIFGFERPEKYLEKFINFEIELDCGAVSERICEKYPEYLALFDKDIFTFEESVEEYLQAIFKDIDIRTQEQLVKKAMLAHKLLFTAPKDYSFMCMELLLAVMICVHNDDSCFTYTSINAAAFDKVFSPYSNGPVPAFADFFKKQFERIPFRKTEIFPDEGLCYMLPERTNLYGAIILSWYWLHKRHRNISIRCQPNGVYAPVINNHKELIKFAEMLKLIQ